MRVDEVGFSGHRVVASKAPVVGTIGEDLARDGDVDEVCSGGGEVVDVGI